MEISNLEKQLQLDLILAMKEPNRPAISAIRSVKTAIQVKKRSGTYHELSDDEIIKIIQKLSKQRQESADIYNSAGRTDAASAELKEKAILDSYLPKLLTIDEITDIISKLIIEVNATSMKDMGKIMKELASRYPNRYDGKTVSSIIKEKLN